MWKCFEYPQLNVSFRAYRVAIKKTSIQFCRHFAAILHKQKWGWKQTAIRQSAPLMFWHLIEAQQSCFHQLFQRGIILVWYTELVLLQVQLAGTTKQGIDRFTKTKHFRNLSKIIFIIFLFRNFYFSFCLSSVLLSSIEWLQGPGSNLLSFVQRWELKL